jgi:putative transposase
VKFELIDAKKAHFPIDFMCQQLGVSRSGYYAWKQRPESERHKADQALAQVVTAVHQESRGTYGSPRVHAELRARGQRVSRKRVARLMGQQGLAARKKRRFVRTTDSRHNQPVAPNILERDFSPGQPNSTWATDITYVGTRQGWLYLAVVLDLFSRKVVGWSMSQRIGIWCSTRSTWRSRDASLREGCSTTRTGAVNTPAPTLRRRWRLAESSAACRARATAGTTPWWRASSAA